MPNKGAAKEKDTEVFHLLPQEGSDVRIYHLKLNRDVFEALRESGGARCKVVFGGKDGAHISVKDTEWKLDTPNRDAGAEVNECIQNDRGVYRTLGAVTQRFTIRAGLTNSMKESIKKNHDEATRKKAGRAAVKHDPCVQQSGKKRKGSKSAMLASEVPQVEDSEVKRRMVHNLALGNLKREALLETSGATPDQLKKLSKEVAKWDQQYQAYCLLPSAFTLIEVEDWAGYTDDQRRVVRARASLSAPSAVKIENEEQAEEERKKYGVKHEEYLLLDARLLEVQKEFEELGRKFNTQTMDGKEGKRRGEDPLWREIEEKFKRSRGDILEKHRVFLKLHDELMAIKDGLKAYKQSKAPATQPPAQA
ncbi:hypothetical protein T484DRAFT_1884958 [Baffinella frigidus]|nr:hypothetical protein T484DRAFT_1884958 [Cryptophyta sp. CCMP2293]